MVSKMLLPYLQLQRMSIRRYSAAAQQPQPQPQPLPVLVSYLVNSIGFTPEAASTATKNLRCSESFHNDPDLVVNYMKWLGLNNDQIKSMISSCPEVLTYDAIKTLKPKIYVLKNICSSKSDIVKILRACPSILLKEVECIEKRIQFLKELLGSYDNVAKALKNCPLLLAGRAQDSIEWGDLQLRRHGFSDEQIYHFLLYCPGQILKPRQKLQDVLLTVEHDLGIPRGSRMFLNAFKVVSSMSKSTMDAKLGVFRHFGWSDATIHDAVCKFPNVLWTSEGKLRNCLGFLMGELGYSPEMLASYPIVFGLSLEKMKLRNDVLNVLNEKKLNQRKNGHFAALVVREKKFLKNYLLPYQSELPLLYKSYIEKFSYGIKLS